MSSSYRHHVIMSNTAPAPATVLSPLSFMEELDPLVSYYRLLKASSSSSAHQPRLIIISSWTDAKDAHVAKYTIKYQALYPDSQILLLRNTMDCMIQPSHINSAMRIAASVVHAAFQAPLSSSSPPLLIHVFSNGGSANIASLYEQFAATAGPNRDKRLPPHVTIFDSCPGHFSMPRAVAFVSVGLPFLQSLIAAPFLYAFTLFWVTLMAPDWYKPHNNNAGNTAELRRVYIYSLTDAIIDYKDVETHAAEAKTKGFSVVLEKYEGSAHVAHLRKDENRYWEIVRRAMEG
jgi:hypothetical protein